MQVTDLYICKFMCLAVWQPPLCLFACNVILASCAESCPTAEHQCCQLCTCCTCTQNVAPNPPDISDAIVCHRSMASMVYALCQRAPVLPALHLLHLHRECHTKSARHFSCHGASPKCSTPSRLRLPLFCYADIATCSLPTASCVEALMTE